MIPGRLMTSFLKLQNLHVSCLHHRARGLYADAEGAFHSPRMKWFVIFIILLILVQLLASRGRELFKSSVRTAGVPKAPASSGGTIWHFLKTASDSFSVPKTGFSLMALMTH